MQKKIIALAVAGLMSGAAFAQSNVTISGRVDVGYQYTKTDGLGAGVADTTSGIDSGIHDGSRIAFAGEEALGNGLKAIFMLEYRLANDINSGVGTTGSRQQWLGLSGNFGTVVAGQLYTPSDDMGAYDSMDQTNFSPRLGLMGVSQDDYATRFSNAVRYTSPSFGGLTVSGIYGFVPVGDGVDTAAHGASLAAGDQKDQERGMGLGVTYAAGPLSVSLFHDRIYDLSDIAITSGHTGDDVRTTRLGASYDFGAVALYGTYEQGKLSSSSNNITTAAGHDDKGKMWSIGATVPLGNGLLRTQYAVAKSNLGNDGTVAIAAAPDCADGALDCQSKGKGYGIGYDYNLSKRTMLYTGYSYVKTDYDVAGANDRKVKTLGFGMLHKF